MKVKIFLVKGKSGEAGASKARLSFKAEDNIHMRTAVEGWLRSGYRIAGRQQYESFQMARPCMELG